MAEAIGAAGTAVGVVSLAIETCQGLLEYYGKWKDYHDDIADACSLIASLEQSLELLNSSARDPAFEEHRRMQLQACIEEHGEGLRKLQKRLAKVGEQASLSDAQKAFRAGCLRLLYPFKSTSVEKLVSLVKKLLYRTQLALDVLHIDTSKRILTTVSEIDGRLDVIAKTLDGLRVSTNTLSEHAKSRLEDDERKRLTEVLDYLSAPEPATDHNDARRKHEAGTGAWFIQGEIYQEWLKNDNARLWVSGKAGCCKTVLCSTIIEDVAKRAAGRNDMRNAFFYCSFSEQTKRTYRGFLLSCLSQLLRNGNVAPDAELLEACDKRRSLTIPQLEKWIVAILELCRSPCIIVDALDEVPRQFGSSDGRQDFLDGLSRLASALPTARFLATSRDEDDIKAFMKGWATSNCAIESQSVDRDIRMWTEQQLKIHPRLKHLRDTIKHEISDTFSSKSDGMFRWAFLQLAKLADAPVLTPRHVRMILQSLPKTLSEAYTEILLSIDEVYRAAARKALMWLAMAERPLTQRELEEAIIVDPQGQPAVVLEERAEAGSCATILSSLVTVSPRSPDRGRTIPLANTESQIISLAHFSVKEFLVSQSIFASDAAAFGLDAELCHRILAESCAAYLLHVASATAVGWNNYKREESLRTERDRHLFKQRPLGPLRGTSWRFCGTMQIRTPEERTRNLFGRQARAERWYVDKICSNAALCRYAVNHLADHLRQQDFSNDSKPPTARVPVSIALFQDTEAIQLFYDFLHIIGRSPEPYIPKLRSDGDDLQFLSTYVAALLGLPLILSTLVAQGASLDLQNSSRMHPADIALLRGDDVLLRSLLQDGLLDPQSWVVQAVGFYCRPKAIELLASFGANFNINARLLLLSVSTRGWVDRVAMYGALAAAGLDFRKHAGPALGWARFVRDEDGMAALIKHGALSEEQCESKDKLSDSAS